MLAINYNLFKSIMSAKKLRAFYAPTRTVLISVVVLTLTGSPGCAQDDAELEAVSQSSDATVMPNDAAITDLSVAADIVTSDDASPPLSVELMRAKSDDLDTDNALQQNTDETSPADTDAVAGSGGETGNTAQVEAMHAEKESVAEEPVEGVVITTADESTTNEEDVTSEENTETAPHTSSPADTEAAAVSGIQIESTTLVEGRHAENERVDDEEPTESMTTTTENGSDADEHDLVSEEDKENAPNPSPSGNAVLTTVDATHSATDTGTDGKYATKEELNYVSNLVVDVQREIKSIKNSSVSESRFTEIQAAVDAIKTELDQLRNGEGEPDISLQISPEEEETDDEKIVPEEEDLPEDVLPPPFKLVLDEDGTPLLQRKGQAAKSHLQGLADAGKCKKIGDWLEQTGIKLPKRVVFVQKNNRVAKCKQINSGKWKVYSSSASDTGYVALPNGD